MARRILLPALVLLASTAGCRVFPQPPPGWDPELPFRAEAVLRRAVEKGYGLDPDARIEDLVVTFSVEPAEGAARRYALLWKRPDLWRLDVLDEPGRRFVGRGGVGVEFRGGEIVRRGVSIRELPVDRVLRHLFWADFFLRGAGKPAEISDVVRRPEGGFSLLIEKFDAAGRRFVVALDAGSLAPLSLREWIEDGRGGFVPVETRIAETFRSRLGVEAPRRLEVKVAGRPDRVLTIEDVDADIGLSAEDFPLR